MQQINDLIRGIILSIVDDQDNIEIDDIETRGGTLYEIRAGADDVGKLIGKDGRVASAIRIIARAVGAKMGSHISVNVVNEPLQK